MKKTITIVISLILLQLLRIGLRKTAFSFAEHTLLADAVYSLVFMAGITYLIILIARKKNYELNVWPAKFSRPYVVFTIIVAAIFVLTPFITQDTSLYNVVFLVYGALVTPVFEELIFRGYIWRELEVKGDKTAWLTTTILFAFWHLGYIDTIIWRTSMFEPDADILRIMIMKVITGAVIGAILGALRYKTKNAYSPILLHCLINTVGG